MAITTSSSINVKAVRKIGLMAHSLSKPLSKRPHTDHCSKCARSDPCLELAEVELVEGLTVVRVQAGNVRGIGRAGIVRRANPSEADLAHNALAVYVANEEVQAAAGRPRR